MAITFKLKYGDPASWSYIDLTDSSHGYGDYVPGAPAEGAEDLTESGVWRVHATSAANLITAVQAIEDVLRRAAEYDLEQVGSNQVFVTASVDGSTTWESPIYEARVELPNSLFGPAAWGNFYAELTITWRRAPYWQHYMDLTISNANSSSLPVSSLTVYNRQDGSGAVPNSKLNYFVTETVIPGNLPAPAFIKAVVGTNPAVERVMVCQIGRSGAKENHYFEAEIGSADSIDANRSGGKYHIFGPYSPDGVNVGSGGTYLQTSNLGHWRRFVLSAKFNGVLKARPYIGIGTNYYYGASSLITGLNVGFQQIDLGMVYVPALANYPGSSTLNYYGSAGVNLGMSTGANFAVDYVQASKMDSYAVAALDVAMGANAGDTILIDSLQKSAVGIVDHGGGVLEYKSACTLFGGIFLDPAVQNTLILKLLSGGLDDLTAQAVVSLGCWARKKTL